MGDLLKYGLIAVGGYLLYSAFTSGTVTTAAAAPAPAPAGTAPAAAAPAPAAPTSSGATVAALKTWAAGQPGYNGTLTSDQWHYAWITVLQKTPVPDAIFFQLFPGGTPPMTADSFVAALQSQGLSGLGRGMPRNISAPAAMAVAVARAKQLRAAGVRNYQLAGTPMPRGMR